MKVSQRLVALDVFRGLTIVLMIIVNTPGTWAHVYPPLLHSAWNGCTPTDLVFPFFLFIVGVAMWFSFRKFNHELNRTALKKIIYRTFLIFLIGLLMNGFPYYNLTHIRILGVLQRIALAYGIGAIFVLLLNRRDRWIGAIIILLLYWLVLRMFGGDSPFALETNLVRKIDLFLFGSNHVWHGFPLYSNDKIPFDPEGLLSTFPAMVNVILGYQVGEFIGLSENHRKVSARLLIYGAIGVIIGLIWNQFFPINKPIWTSSYVVFTVGAGTILLAILIWVIDIKNWKGWIQPFQVFGMNPLFIYVLSELIVMILFLFQVNVKGIPMNGYSWLYQVVFVPIGGDGKFSSLLFALFYALFCWFIGYILYRKKIYIKI